MKKDKQMEFKVNTPQLIKEIFECYPNGQGDIFRIPFNVLQALLAQVASRASELNDPVLNALMCRMALYGESDPYDKKNFNASLTKNTIDNPAYKEWKAGMVTRDFYDHLKQKKP
jgi:hypothetical protein